MQRILIGGPCVAAVALTLALKAQQLEEIIVSAPFLVQNVFEEFFIVGITGQQVVGIESGHGLPCDYKRRFGVSLRMNF